jgi:hypothetical protein
MANVWKGTFDIELGGDTYSLRPSFDAMCEFEDKTGMAVSVAQRQMAQEGITSFKTVVAAIWAGILGECIATNREDKVPSYRVIGEKIRIEGINKFAILAAKFLTYAIIPEETIRQIEAESHSDDEAEEKKSQDISKT